MEDLINGQPEQDIEHCATCVHAADSEDICILRKCKYAIAELKDCYEPDRRWIPCNKRLPDRRWIPCNKRLPDAECGESDIVLATCGYMNVKDTRVRWIKTLYFNGGNWCYPTGETYEQKVYAWMPLPEPYMGDNK